MPQAFACSLNSWVTMSGQSHLPRGSVNTWPESCQWLDYTDDVDLREKLVAWESFYNLHRPHGGLGGKTPYEILREKMAS